MQIRRKDFIILCKDLFTFSYVLDDGVITKFNIVNGSTEKMFDFTFTEGDDGHYIARGAYVCCEDKYRSKFVVEPGLARFTLEYVKLFASVLFLI